MERPNIDGIPYGPLRIQVLAPGFQTFGEDYRIDKAEMQITVKLKRPGGQYSIYDNHGDVKKDDEQNQPTKNRRNRNLRNRENCVTTERGTMKRRSEGKLKLRLAIAAIVILIVFATGLATAQDGTRRRRVCDLSWFAIRMASR